MDDKTSLQRISQLHPRLREEVATILTEIHSKGIEIRIAQGFRSFAEQDALYSKGRNGVAGPIVTNAKGGQSYHNFGLAVDFCLLHKDGSISWDLKEDADGDKVADWNEVVQVFSKFGWSWGGVWKFKDNPHFEKTFGFNFLQLNALPKDGSGYVVFP